MTITTGEGGAGGRAGNAGNGGSGGAAGVGGTRWERSGAGATGGIGGNGGRGGYGGGGGGGPSIGVVRASGAQPVLQDIVYEHPNPILLRCASSPHVYLVDRGEKRWIETIETFNGRGYVWRDVQLITCGELRSIPDGTPIPANAGQPPQP